MFDKYTISMLRYGTARIDETGIHPTYQGAGASCFDTPKDALDAYIQGCTVSSLFHPRTEKGYTVFGPSRCQPLHKYAEHYYLPVYGETDGNVRELKVYIMGQLYAVLNRKELSCTTHNIDFNNEPVEKVMKALEHANQIVTRHHDRWKADAEKQKHLAEIDPLHKIA